MTRRRLHNICWGLVVWVLPVGIAGVLSATVGRALTTKQGLASLDQSDLALLYGALLVMAGIRALYRRRVEADNRLDVKAYEAFHLGFWSMIAALQWPWSEAWSIAAVIMATSYAFTFLLRVLEAYGFNELWGSMTAAVGLVVLLALTNGNRPKIEIVLGMHEVSLWGVAYLAALAYLCVFTFDLARSLWRTLRGEMLPARYASTDHQSSG